MRALIAKELKAFFNGLIAYLVIVAFLVIMGLFLWVFPAGYNIPDSGYASMDGFFTLAPFILLFLVPAITMRFFADEKRMGTMEMLMTKPLTAMQLVLSKYIAGVVLVFFSLLLTLIYVLTLVVFAAPPGPDMGGIWGSYLGLFFLGMVFVAIGLFASSITENQIVSFILALFFSGFIYIGFEMLHSMELMGPMDLFIRNLGLYSHYSSMGRGVVDSRDLLYFLGVIALFITFTQLVINKERHNRSVLTPLLAVIVLVIAVNLLAGIRFVRLDLTSDKRYSLTRATREMLRELDEVLYFRIYLDGNLPADFRRLRNDTREMLDEFSAYSDQVRYSFINPAEQAGDDPEALRELYRQLASKGLEPTQIQMRAGDGSSQRVLFPGALLTYGDREIPVPLLQDHLGLSIQDILHNSTMGLEYTLASAIKRVTRVYPPRIAFLDGKGGYTRRELASATAALEAFYEVDWVGITEGTDRLSEYRTLIAARPRKAFSQQEKFLLDQYLMNGGSMLWLVDPVFADMDSLAGHYETTGMAWDIHMDDFFFRYGLRLNPVLLKDLNAAPHPFTTGMVAGRPQINVLPWFYFPVLTPRSEHPVVRNLNVIRTEFISSIDTVEVENVRQHVLLETSPHTRIMPVPVRISLDVLQFGPDEALYGGPPQPVAVLLEGQFTSLYRNRLVPTGLDLPEGFQRRDEGEATAMIVMADGSVIKNQFGSDGRPLPLGYDRVSGHQFGNEDFILNAVNYLADDSGIMEARARDIRQRLLDSTRLNRHKASVQLINLLVPSLVVIVFGVVRVFFRRRKYSA